MADTLGLSRETLTNQQLHDLLWGGKDVPPSTFEELIKIGHSLKGQAVLNDCDFLKGLSIQGISEQRVHVAHDLKFDGSTFHGDCHFEHLQLMKLISLLNVNGRGATFHFKEVSVSRAEAADIWLSFKDKDSIPNLDTEDKVIREMFRRLHNDPTSFVSYNEVREELK